VPLQTVSAALEDALSALEQFAAAQP